MQGILYMNVELFADKKQFEKGIKLVSKNRKEKIMSYSNPSTARLSLGAGVLLYMAMERCGMLEKMEKIKIAPHGKPYLEGSDFHFSLSHSGTFAVCAYSNSPIGVDLQIIKEKLPKHLEKILSIQEKCYLSELQEEERKLAFFRLWTRKESLVKWDGRGLHIPLNKLNFAVRGNLLDILTFDGHKLFFEEFDMFLPEYAFCFCGEKNEFPLKVEDMTQIFLTNY